MSFERLWAPWRLEYVTGGESEARVPEPIDWLPGADRACFVCRAAAKYEPNTNVDRSLMVVAARTTRDRGSQSVPLQQWSSAGFAATPCG